MKIQVGSAGQFGFLMLKQSLVFQFALPEEQERAVLTDRHNTLTCFIHVVSIPVILVLDYNS